MSQPQPPLPEGWTRAFSRSKQREYFVHTATGKSVWKLDDVTPSFKRKRDGDESESAAAAAGDASGKESSKKAKSDQGNTATEGAGRRVCVIVPFRDLHERQQRSEHLRKFVPHMVSFLGNNPGISDYHVLIVEQSDDKRKFNRGKLLNIGFRYATEEMAERKFDSFIFHDVDLLPQEPLAEWYAKLPVNPIHIARAWGRYNSSDTYFGGIVAFGKENFKVIDGFPNTYWGWGGEDDELSVRVREEHKMHIDAPSKTLPNAIIDLENMDLRTKLNLLKKTDWKCNVKWEVRDEYAKFRAQRDSIPWWGLKGTKFDLLETIELDGGKGHSTKIQVDVKFNFNQDDSEHWANKTENLH